MAVWRISENLKFQGQGHRMTKNKQNSEIKSRGHNMTKDGPDTVLDVMTESAQEVFGRPVFDLAY